MKTGTSCIKEIATPLKWLAMTMRSSVNDTFQPSWLLLSLLEKISNHRHPALRAGTQCLYVLGLVCSRLFSNEAAIQFIATTAKRQELG